MGLPFFTIGHSDRSLHGMIALLGGAGVGFLADIRKMPMSRANPQFNGASLAPALAEAGIGYEHVAALGGLRGAAPAIPPEVNGLWKNRSFHNYADYALSPGFAEGLTHIMAIGAGRRLAIMCAEAVWWRCHRRIVADHLIARGKSVFHIIGEGPPRRAELTPGAVIGADHGVTYPGPFGAKAAP